eukprot:gene12386-14151_t
MSDSDSSPAQPASCSTMPNQDVANAIDAMETKDTLENGLLQICNLSRNSRTTKFASSEWFLHERACPLSSIRVAGIDRDIPIPISKEDMLLLKAHAQQAPFGFGQQTLMDQTVRDAWQVDGRNVWSESQPSFFQRTVQTMVLTSLRSQLGLATYTMDVHATLYKVLLYEEGGHFLSHRDTEKEPGMFGTYLLQIPVEDGHEDGQLHIRHLGQEVVVDTSTQSASAAFQEVMFYADCEHELKGVTRGRRCVLAFNLSWRATASDNVAGKKRAIDVDEDESSEEEEEEEDSESEEEEEDSEEDDEEEEDSEAEELLEVPTSSKQSSKQINSSNNSSSSSKKAAAKPEAQPATTTSNKKGPKAIVQQAKVAKQSESLVGVAGLRLGTSPPQPSLSFKREFYIRARSLDSARHHCCGCPVALRDPSSVTDTCGALHGGGESGSRSGEGMTM